MRDVNPLLAIALLLALGGAAIFVLSKAASAVFAPPSPRPIWRGGEGVIRVRARMRAFLVLAPLFFAWITWMAIAHPSPKGHLPAWVIALVGTTAVVFSAYGAMQSFVEFRAGTVGLTRHGLLRRRTVEWTDVRAIELTSGPWVRSTAFMRFTVRSTDASIDVPLMMAGISSFGAFALERLPPAVIDRLTSEARYLLQDLASHSR